MPSDHLPHEWHTVGNIPACRHCHRSLDALDAILADECPARLRAALNSAEAAPGAQLHGWVLPVLHRAEAAGTVTVAWLREDVYVELTVAPEGLEAFWKDRRTGAFGGTNDPAQVPGLYDALVRAALGAVKETT